MTLTRRALDPTVLEEFRRHLLAARGELLRTVALTEEEMATLERHQPGALIEDAGRDQVLAVLSRLEGLERHALEEIFTAYAKLDAGTFGTCEACGAELPLSRLRALPTARYCLSCQTRREGVSR